MLHLFDRILPLVNSLSTFLQSKSGEGEAARVSSLVDAMKHTLVEMQTDDAFKNIYDTGPEHTMAGHSVYSNASQSELSYGRFPSSCPLVVLWPE